MNIDTTAFCSTGCTCNHYAPPHAVLIKPETNHDLATYWTQGSSSARVVHEALLDELYVYHTGTLHGFARDALDLFAFDGRGDDIIDRAFGKDAYRTLRRYLDHAQVLRIQRLTKAHHQLALFAFHARAIRKCRTIGFCAGRAQQNPHGG